MQDVKRYLENLSEERNTAALYRTLAKQERDARTADVYRRLAEAEDRHATHWAGELRRRGIKAPPFRLSWRTRTLGWLAQQFGVKRILPSLARQELRDSTHYAADSKSAMLARDEGEHAAILRQLSRASGGMESVHRSMGGNALRAAVLGASDGLLSNFSLVMGVAGAKLDNQVILLTGCAGLLAGAFSMSLGEWISVQSSRELYQKDIETEKEEIANHPEEETEELALIYQARGMDEDTARKWAMQVMQDPETAVDAHVRDELGIDARGLGGSAMEAATMSFLLFAAGAIIPIIPFMFFKGLLATGLCTVFSAIGLFLLGAAITLFTGRSVWYSGTRQVLIGLASAAAVYAVGHIIGVSISG